MVQRYACAGNAWFPRAVVPKVDRSPERRSPGPDAPGVGGYLASGPSASAWLSIRAASSSPWMYV